MVIARKVISTTIFVAVAALLFHGLKFHLHPVWDSHHFASPEHLAGFLRSFGAMTVVVSLLLMVLQTLFTPLPLFLLAGANGFIFGLWYGTLITLSGSILGATMAFYLARGFGRGIICRFLKQTYMAKVDKMSHSEGPWMVFMARLIPIIPSSIISYVAGLSKITFRGFFIATAVGKLPEIVIYTALGHSFSQAEGMATKVTILLILLTLLAWPLISRILKKNRNRDTPIKYHKHKPPHKIPPVK
ncbi:MAG: TVP38/TMEM64 family protein [Bacillota bacterium]